MDCFLGSLIYFGACGVSKYVFLWSVHVYVHTYGLYSDVLFLVFLVKGGKFDTFALFALTDIVKLFFSKLRELLFNESYVIVRDTNSFHMHICTLVCTVTYFFCDVP